MTSHPEISDSAEVCSGVKRLGYRAKQTVRLYGEEFEVISDPFPESGGIAITVRAKRNDSHSGPAFAGDGVAEPERGLA